MDVPLGYDDKGSESTTLKKKTTKKVKIKRKRKVLKRRNNTSGSLSRPFLNLLLFIASIKVGTTKDGEKVRLLSGLDQVIGGQLPASECVKVCGVKPPQYLFYSVSGMACDVIQIIIDSILFHTAQIKDHSFCWSCSFVISILFRHSSHRYLVFGAYVGGYWRSLCRMYGGYSFSIVFSTFFNWLITTKFQAEHYVAYIFTLLWTGGVNYFILKRLWSFTGNKNEKEEENINNRMNHVHIL